MLNSTALKGRYTLREHLLGRVGSAFQAAGNQPVLLIKGAALAAAGVYDPPWLRDMCDIDLVVPNAAERHLAVEALKGIGGVEDRYADRSFSQERSGERALTFTIGGGELTIEVHPNVDKVAPRAIDYAGFIARGSALPDLRPLVVPCAEDHLQLVLLHLAVSDFDHPSGWQDVDRLVGLATFDWSSFVGRVQTGPLTTAVYGALRHQASRPDPEAAAVPSWVFERLRPGLLRELGLAYAFRLGEFPPRSFDSHGTGWIARQLLLRDDLLHWSRGIVEYAAMRCIDRLRHQGGETPK